MTTMHNSVIIAITTFNQNGNQTRETPTSIAKTLKTKSRLLLLRRVCYYYCHFIRTRHAYASLNIFELLLHSIYWLCLMKWNLQVTVENGRFCLTSRGLWRKALITIVQSLNWPLLRSVRRLVTPQKHQVQIELTKTCCLQIHSSETDCGPLRIWCRACDLENYTFKFRASVHNQSN